MSAPAPQLSNRYIQAWLRNDQEQQLVFASNNSLALILDRGCLPIRDFNLTNIVRPSIIRRLHRKVSLNRYIPDSELPFEKRGSWLSSARPEDLAKLSWTVFAGIPLLVRMTIFLYPDTLLFPSSLASMSQHLLTRNIDPRM